MSHKARRIPERIQDIREAIEHVRSDASVVWDTIRRDLPRLESLLGGLDVRSSD